MFFNHITDTEKLKSTYRQMSKLYHPDADGGDEQKFKELTAEYKAQKVFLLTGKRPSEQSHKKKPHTPQNSDFMSELLKHPIVQEYAPIAIDHLSTTIKNKLMEALVSNDKTTTKK